MRSPRLGRRAYKRYLATPHWAQVRARFRERPCWACGCDGPTEPHHLSYARLGAERDDDLRPLGRGCHALVHRLARLSGLSVWRATHAVRRELAKPPAERWQAGYALHVREALRGDA